MADEIPNTMIERMARAICVKYVKNDLFWREHVDMAIAILTAMREPTAPILAAMRQNIPAWSHELEYYEDDAPDCWRSMIDAALADQ